jgi:PAS domain S-box-containing protein
MVHTFGQFWHRYKVFVENAMQECAPDDKTNMAYWRERLFLNCILYCLPVGLLILVPCIYVLFTNGHFYLIGFASAAVMAIGVVLFNKQLKIVAKKKIVIGILYLLGVGLIAALGDFGIGSVYLLTLSVCISLLFCNKLIIQSIAGNAAIYAAFGLIIYFKLFNSPLIQHYTTDIWITYSLNFILLNIIIAVQIRHVISGFEDAIDTEVSLMQELKVEMGHKTLRNQQLKESEAHYKSLFFLNPTPMWIYDTDSLHFLQVNDAAVRKYGYTENEFLTMTIKDIRPKHIVDELLNALDDVGRSQMITLHRHKDGHAFDVDVRCSTIPFNGKQARLVMARNITTQITHIKAIEQQNTKLREIAFMQSHVVRAPLARIMALTSLIMQEIPESTTPELLDYLDVSVKELDGVIKTIVNNTEEQFDIAGIEDRVE